MEIKMSVIPGKNPGTAGKIQVKENDHVVAGVELASIETAKGNRVIKAPGDGTIAKILFHEGDEIKSNQVLFEFKEDPVKEVQTEIVEIKMSVIPGKKTGNGGKASSQRKRGSCGRTRTSFD